MMDVQNASIGKLKTKAWKVSASQIKKAMECFRSWGYAYIEDIKDPAGPGALLGSATHNELEHHFKGDRAIDRGSRPGRIAKSGLHLLPTPGDHGLVEPPIYFTVEGVNYRGFIDLTWHEDDVLVISDHKTSSNPKKYGLTAEQLLTDPQALIYAVWALHHFKVDKLRLQWTYLPTKKGEPYAVRQDITRDEALANFFAIVHPVALAIVEAVRSVDEAKALPANGKACGNYGGCPHAEYCPRTSAEKLDAVFSDEKESKNVGLSDLIKKKKKTPPKPAELAAAKEKDNVVAMPGQRINSPEAPKSPEIAQTISQSGDPKSAAAAAAGAETPEQAEQLIKDAEPEISVGAPDGWDPSLTPSQDQVLAWVCSDSFTEFTPDRKKATKELPFAHGRSLGSMGRAGLIEHARVGDTYRVGPTEKGTAKYKTIADGDIWIVAPSPTSVTPPAIATKTTGTVDITTTMATTTETKQKQLVAIYQRVDGKVIIEIDPEAFAG